MNDIAFKVIIKNDGIDDVIFKTIMLKGEKGDKGDAGGAEIDDSTTSSTKTWSSNKIRNEIDAKPVNLSQLGDVDLDTITDGQMLGYNLTAGKWENKDATASSLKYDANTSIKSKIDDKADSAGLSLVAVSGAYDDLSNKPTIPDELNDMTDVDISGQTSGEALVWDGTKWTNGSVSSVGSIDDLSDVDTTGKSAGDCLRFDGSDWISEKQVIELTQAEYDALQSKQPNTLYVITDAQNLNATADDIEFSAGVSVADELNDLETSKADRTEIPTINDFIKVRKVTTTTNANGFVNITFDSRVVVLSAWGNLGDVLIIPFASVNANEHGQNIWWFRVHNDNMQIRANFSFDLYIAYVEV